MSIVPPGRKSRPRPELRLPTEAESRQADESRRRLDPILGEDAEADVAPIRLVACQDGGDPAELVIPRHALLLLEQVLAEMARGNAVRLESIRPHLSIAQAAELLDAPRPYVFNLIETGELPSRIVDSYPEVSFVDLMAYKKRVFEERGRVLDELVALGQEIGVGYER